MFPYYFLSDDFVTTKYKTGHNIYVQLPQKTMQTPNMYLLHNYYLIIDLM